MLRSLEPLAPWYDVLYFVYCIFEKKSVLQTSDIYSFNGADVIDNFLCPPHASSRLSMYTKQYHTIGQQFKENGIGFNKHV